LAEISRYGAYLPKYRVPLGEVQKFFGRPGRPRSKTLSIPALDEDALTMAYEAADQALGDEARPPGALIAVTLSPPFGLRKVSSTVVEALGLPAQTTTYDLGGHPGSLSDAFGLAESLVTSVGSVLVVASDYIVSFEERVCDTLAAGGAAAFLVTGSGGFARLGATAKASVDVYDVWFLAREREPRYRLEVLFETTPKVMGDAIQGLEAASGTATADYRHIAASQPHPQVLRGLGKAGVSNEQLAHTSFVADIGNLGVASLGLALALSFDHSGEGEKVLAISYGAGEAIARGIDIIAAPPAVGIGDRLAGEAIDLGTYYRWTRGRQAEPH
jgi:hydroxymethylglutaryl-CoA synthase